VTDGLLVTREGQVLVVTLANGERNEISDAMVVALTRCFREPEAGTAAIVVRARGSIFCGGRAAGPPPSPPAGLDAYEWLRTQGVAPILALYEAIRSAPVPVACFVQGLASGLGAALVASCDHAVAAADAQFDAPELDKQFAPGLLMSALVRRVQRQTIGRLVLSMQPISAQDALSAGLVSQVVPADTLGAAADAFIQTMNSRSPHALAGVKRFLREEPGSRDAASRAALGADVTAASLVVRSKPFAEPAPQPSGRIPVGGEDVAYDDHGTGPVLVLLHSLGTSRELWSVVAAQWARQFRVIAIDARGHGASTNRGGYLPEGVAADVLGVLDALKIDRFALLGISMGGLTAVRVAAAAGPRVISLVLSNSYVSAAGPRGEQRMAAVEQMLGRLPMAGFARAYVEQTLAPGTAWQERERVARQIAAVSKEDYLQTVRAICRDDVTPFLPRVHARTLVLAGENDLSVPKDETQRLAAGIAGASLAEVPGTRHLACCDAPDAYARIVAQFVSAGWH
jgi:pimeloyl-ACP methyl ester carboxylesterase/enoyl-CoA hydratase/carnithine racemase